MPIEIGAHDYNELGKASIERLKNGFKNKEGLEETMDCEMGPDVRYVLSRNDISLVKRYLMGPITPAEFRELRQKLIQLQSQEVIAEEVKKNAEESQSESKLTCSDCDKDKEKEKENLFNDDESLFHLTA